MFCASMSRRTRAALGGLVLWLAPALASAEPSADCPTWFPDFRCERSGRPEGWNQPIIAPYLFEDPFITTNLTGVYIYHEFGDRSIFQGGHMHVAALQARVALTDRLALIATKDGIAWNRPETRLQIGPDNRTILDNTKGFFNIAGGLKYAILDHREDGWIVSGIARFEFATGSTDTFQGRGNGIFLPSISAAWEPFENFHLIGDFGSQIPFDNGQTKALHYHLYADYNLFKRFSPFIQFTGKTNIGSGNGKIDVQTNAVGTIPLTAAQNAVLGGERSEAADIINLGSEGVSGKTLITLATGLHVKLWKHLTWAAGYEYAVSGYKGVFKQRMTTTLRLEF